MPTFDPIATATVRKADHLEPAFVHAHNVEVAKRKLGGRRKPPNILIYLMDDVGWGDFGCYGGGVAVGAPTPNFDKLARQGLQLTSCYSEPSCSPSRATLHTGRVPNRHGLHRPPMYGEPGGLQGEVTLPMLLGQAGYTTQAVGKWHIGENIESQPQNVGYDDFYGFLSVSDMYTEWRDPHFFPEIVYSEARTEWVKNMPFNKCFVHAKKGQQATNVEEVTIPVLSELDDKWCRYSVEFIEKQADSQTPWLLYHCTRGAHFDNYPHEKFLGKSPARHPYKDTLIELDDIMGRLVESLRQSGQLEDTLIFVSSDNGPHMETWPDSAFTPFRSSPRSSGATEGNAWLNQLAPNTNELSFESKLSGARNNRWYGAISDGLRCSNRTSMGLQLAPHISTMMLNILPSQASASWSVASARGSWIS